MKKGLAALMQRLEQFRPKRLDHSFWTWDLGDDWNLDDEDLTRTLVEHRPAPLLFNRIPAGRILQDLEKIGLLERIRALGYGKVYPTFGGEDQFENRFCLMGEHPLLPQAGILIDIRTHQGEWSMTCPVSNEKLLVRGLILDWVSMQDPAHSLASDRLALPGQAHPGLGMFRTAFTLTMQYIGELSLDVVLNIPQYFHNAVLYSSSFRFVMPQRQGRFEAMMRDLLPAGLAHASHALDVGRVQLLSAAPPRVVRWTPAEQMFPIDPRLSAFLEDARYTDAVAAERELSRYRVISDTAPVADVGLE